MKKLILSIIALFLISATSFSQVFVDQITGRTDAGGRPAQLFPDFNMCALETADDFTVHFGALWDVDSIHTLGAMNFGSSFDTVAVTFYTDNSGVPGAIYATDTVVLPTANFDPLLKVGLNQTVTFTPGTYWVTVNVVMAFGTYGQWFQGAFGTTAIGNEWYLRDPCDLLGAGNTGWQSSTSMTGGTTDMMYTLLSETPCATVIDTSTAVLDATITGYQLGAGYQWINCNDNSFLVDDTNRIFTATANGQYACIIYSGCAIDTTSCVTISCVGTIDNTVTINPSNVTCNDVTADSYQWLDCNNGYSVIPGETSKTFIATVTGNYACELIKGCSYDTTSCTNVVISGINDLVSDISISVYPNPTKGLLTIEKGNHILTKVNVLNLTGEIVITTVLNKDNINVSELPSGVYILEMKTNEGTGYSKFIKE
jgi:hypothetical protein